MRELAKTCYENAWLKCWLKNISGKFLESFVNLFHAPVNDEDDDSELVPL